MAFLKTTFKSLLISVTILSSSLVPSGQCTSDPESHANEARFVERGFGKNPLTVDGQSNSNHKSWGTKTLPDSEAYSYSWSAAGAKFGEVHIWTKKSGMFKPPPDQPVDPVSQETASKPSFLSKIGYRKKPVQESGQKAPDLVTFRLAKGLLSRPSKFSTKSLIVMGDRTWEDNTPVSEGKLTLASIMRSVWTKVYDQKLSTLQRIDFTNIEDPKAQSLIEEARRLHSSSKSTMPTTWEIQRPKKAPSQAWSTLAETKYFKAVQDLLSTANRARNTRGISSMRILYTKKIVAPGTAGIILIDVTFTLGDSSNMLSKLKNWGTSSKYDQLSQDDEFEVQQSRTDTSSSRSRKVTFPEGSGSSKSTFGGSHHKLDPNLAQTSATGQFF